jgi:hypothetical protein
VLITAALGVQFVGRWLAERLNNIFRFASTEACIRAAVALLVVIGSVAASTMATPYFRLYLNSLGGGASNAGFYFAHDEFYDTSMREAIAEIATRSKNGARVASESPSLAAYYSVRANRTDLVCVSLSDSAALKEFQDGDYVIAARGRRYFSNDAVLTALRQSSTPDFYIAAGNIPSVEVYRMDHRVLELVSHR